MRVRRFYFPLQTVLLFVVIMNTLTSKVFFTSAFLSLPLLMASCEKKNTESSAAAEALTSPKAKEQVIHTLELEEPKEPSSVIVSPAVEATDDQPVGVLHEAPDTHEGSKPFILQSLNDIKLNPGDIGPKVGDMIYTMSNLPKGECGEFWVKSSDGMVAQLAVCSGDHEGGH